MLTNNSSSSSDRDIINSVNNSHNLSSDSYINNDGEHDGKTDINSEYQSLAVIASPEPKHKREYYSKSIFHHWSNLPSYVLLFIQPILSEIRHFLLVFSNE